MNTATTERAHHAGDGAPAPRTATSDGDGDGDRDGRTDGSADPVPIGAVGIVATGARRALAIGSALVSAGSAACWLGWRVLHLGMHPLGWSMFVLELLGAVSGAVISLGLLRGRGTETDRQGTSGAERDDSHRFAHAVADLVGRTRSTDLCPDLRSACLAVRRTTTRRSEDAAIAAVLTDGPRRFLLIITVTASLLVGVAPFPVPPLWALAAASMWLTSDSIAHLAAGNGRIRIGDRIRWASSALGEVVVRAERPDLAPRRWVGTVAAVVVLNVAIALRGTSDRWTHGLSPMGDDARATTMLLAIGIVVGGLFTLRTTAPPDLSDAHLVSRRFEERTARQSMLGAAVSMGVVGLLAGVVPVSSSTSSPFDVPAEVPAVATLPDELPDELPDTVPVIAPVVNRGAPDVVGR
ncbi:MAG: hypothetical protein ABIO83_00440 [Ilumatobacteraceae bacterium]